MKVILAWSVGLTALCASAGAAHAGAYANHSFAYAVELPVGWAARGAADANPAEFEGPGGVSAKLRVIPRPEPLTADVAARLSHGDEEKLFHKFSKAKAINLKPAPLGSGESNQYGFVYIDQQAVPRVLRFAVASQPAEAGHMWLKVQFAYPRLAHATASPAIDTFLSGFHWVQPKVAPRSSAPLASIPSGMPLPTDVQSALNAYTSATSRSDTASAGPPGEIADADSAYYLSLNKKMSEAETQQHIETFRANAEHRTEEEMARARSFGMGDILKTNE